ncbi:MAG: hypothetical protein PVF22_01695 [Candidatus Aminicenantes bacterium]|jgi:hypothetical protein
MRQFEISSVIDQRFYGSKEFVEKVKKRMAIQKQVLDKASKENQKVIVEKKNMPEIEILKNVSEITKVSSDSILSRSQEKMVSEARSAIIVDLHGNKKFWL